MEWKCKKGHELYEYRYLQENRCPQCRIDELEQAVKRAINWFRNFGYNSYGVACEDDVEDYTPILAELELIAEEGKYPLCGYALFLPAKMDLDLRKEALCKKKQWQKEEE